VEGRDAPLDTALVPLLTTLYYYFIIIMGTKVTLS
jgi:hypothetical protein